MAKSIARIKGVLIAVLVLWMMGLALLGVGMLPVSFNSTNCGGNSTALSVVSDITMQAHMYQHDPSVPKFSFLALTDEQRRNLGYSVSDHRLHTMSGHQLRKVRYLVSIDPMTLDDPPGRRVIVVCDAPFRNVPQRFFFKAPPSHAAGYSTGIVDLLSESEFANLPWSKFAYLDELLGHAEPGRER
jgi:hypothetical protein